MESSSTSQNMTDSTPEPMTKLQQALEIVRQMHNPKHLKELRSAIEMRIHDTERDITGSCHCGCSEYE